MIDPDVREPDGLTIEVDEAELGQGDVGITMSWEAVEFPDVSKLAILASEALFNVRVAADYVIFETAWHDAGSEQRGTQFPIADEQGGWKSKAHQQLRGLTAEHIEIVKRFQPFAGCSWSRQLRELKQRGQAPQPGACCAWGHWRIQAARDGLGARTGSAGPTARVNEESGNGRRVPRRYGRR